MASNRAHGIVSTGTGRFHLTSLTRTGGGWSVSATRQWNADDPIATARLGSRGISLGVPSFWRSTASPLALSGVESTATDQPLAAQTFTANKAPAATSLAANLTAVYPDDAYLCSLPLALSPECPSSFFSVHASAGVVRVGAVLDRAFVASMRLPADGPLSGVLEAFKRFLRVNFADATLPETIVTLNDVALEASTTFTPLRVRLSDARLDPDDIPMLSSAGAALASVTGGVPTFAADCSRSRLRLVRTGVVSAAVGICALAVIALLAVAGIGLATGWRLGSSKAAYERTLTESADLRKRLDNNETTAREVIDLGHRLAHRTQWTTLISTIASARPASLYFDRMGSEGLDEQTQKVTVALSGWAESDSSITRFIGRLQTAPLITGISLSSMEQSPDDKRTHFTIVCSAQF